MLFGFYLIAVFRSPDVVFNVIGRYCSSGFDGVLHLGSDHIASYILWDEAAPHTGAVICVSCSGIGNNKLS